MTFTFIENGKIDETSRRLIRSQVMKGKNAGKKLSRRRPKTTAKQSERQVTKALPPYLLICNDGDDDGSESSDVPQHFGDDLSYFTFPIKMRPHTRNLIYRFMSVTGQTAYPAQFCRNSKAIESIWFSYVQSNAAFFHCVLAMSETFANMISGQGGTSPRTLRHLNLTYQYINMALQQDAMPSDSTLATTVSLTIHEDLVREMSRSRIHLDALERMVELRGGMDRLNTIPLLRQKICKVDIECALTDGTLPRFFRDEFPRELIEAVLGERIYDELSSQISGTTYIESSGLRNILLDFMAVSRFLNRDIPSAKLEPSTFQQMFISLCYRLLHLYPLSEKPQVHQRDYTYHLALLSLLTTFLFSHGPYHLSYNLLATKLRSAIMDVGPDTITDGELLWLLFVGRISVFEPSDNAWVLLRLKACLFSLQIDSWENALEIIKEHPWVDAIHNKPAQQLWKALVWT